MAWDALGVSWVGLTTFASGLYHAMRGGGGKRKERMFQSRANKYKASDEREKKSNNIRSHNIAQEEIVNS